MKNNIELIRQILDGEPIDVMSDKRTLSRKSINQVYKQLDQLEEQMKTTVMLPNKWLEDISLLLTVIIKTTPTDLGLCKDARGLLMYIHTNKVGDLEILDPSEKKTEDSGGDV